MALPGWGTVAGKLASWFPNPKQHKLNQIDKLVRENVELQKRNPFTPSDSARYGLNADRIKQLRTEVARID